MAKIIIFFCCCIFLFHCDSMIQASSVSDANHYVDSLLQISMTTEIRSNRLDPLIMPPFYDHGKDKIGPVGVNVFAHFLNGTMTGFSKGYRPLDCGTPYFSYGNITFNCSLTFNYLKVNYGAKVKYGKLPERIGEVEVNYTRPLLNMVITSRRGSSNSALAQFTVVSLGKMEMEFSGLGPVNNSVKKALKSGVVNIMLMKMTNAFYGPYSYALTNSVSRTPLPGSLGWF